MEAAQSRGQNTAGFGGDPHILSRRIPIRRLMPESPPFAMSFGFRFLVQDKMQIPFQKAKQKAVMETGP